MTLAERAATKSGFSIGSTDSATTIAHAMVRGVLAGNAFVRESTLAKGKILLDPNYFGMVASKNLFPNCESLLIVTHGQSKLLQLEVSYTKIAKGCCIVWMLFPMQGQSKLELLLLNLQNTRVLFETSEGRNHFDKQDS